MLPRLIFETVIVSPTLWLWLPSNGVIFVTAPASSTVIENACCGIYARGLSEVAGTLLYVPSGRLASAVIILSNVKYALPA